MPKRRFTVTAALPYSNGLLHVGHLAGCYLPADIFVRYLRSHGDEVAFICGSDDYGVPVSLTARKEGKTPREVAAHYRAAQKADFDGMGISFSIYGGTSATDIHTRVSQHFFTELLKNGYLEKRSTRQLYDPEAEMFLPDRYVEGTCPYCDTGGARGDQCEACGKTLDPILLVQPKSVVSGATPEVRETVHWFFLLPKLEPRLKEWLGSHEEWRPMVRNFTLGLLEQGLPERAITRDLEWGIPVPLPDDPDAAGKVLYVWFDAPIGYVSFTAQWCEQQGGSAEDYVKWWKDPETKVVHFIGEDNVVFHALIWPGMLMGEGTFQLPDNVPANCFLNIQFPGEEETKISKSRGTAIWIKEYLEQGQPDPMRYYLTMIAPERQRTAYNPEDLVRRNNDELAAALGNFVQPQHDLRPQVLRRPRAGPRGADRAGPRAARPHGRAAGARRRPDRGVPLQGRAGRGHGRRARREQVLRLPPALGAAQAGHGRVRHGHQRLPEHDQDAGRGDGAFPALRRG